MTHLAVVTTPSYVLISCDLRVTSIRGQSIESQCDVLTKTIQWGYDDVFGFAGRAALGSQVVDEWALERLVSVSPAERLARLAREATERFRVLRIIEPQAFLGAGFTAVGKRRISRSWLVTNAWDDVENRYEPEHVDSRFQVRYLERPSNAVSGLWSVGADRNESSYSTQLDETRAEIENCIRRDSSDPTPIMERLAELNFVASKQGDHIGATSVVTSLPKNADRRAGMSLWLERPDLRSLQRFPFSVTFSADPAKVRAHGWRQPSLISDNGFVLLPASPGEPPSHWGAGLSRLSGGSDSASEK